MTGLSINHYLVPQGYPLARFLDECVAAGATGVGLTERALAEASLADLKGMLGERDLHVTSVNSAGFFLWADPERAARQREANLRLIEAAAELAADTLVTIGGGLHDAAGERPGALSEARRAVDDALPALLELARASGVRLGLEPMHPIRLFSKGTTNTLAQAEALCARHPGLGLALDCFHSWWDPNLEPVLERLAGSVTLVQLCGVTQPADPAQLPKRCLLTEGAVDLAGLIGHLDRCGYTGRFEFELFAQDLDGRDVSEVIRRATGEFATLRAEAERCRS